MAVGGGNARNFPLCQEDVLASVVLLMIVDIEVIREVKVTVARPFRQKTQKRGKHNGCAQSRWKLHD